MRRFAVGVIVGALAYPLGKLLGLHLAGKGALYPH